MRIGLLVAAGLLAGLGQAPWGLWPLALLGYAAGLRLLAESKRPFLAGWSFGTAHFALVLHWITEPFLVDAAATGWLMAPALLAVSLGMGLFWAIAAALGHRMGGAMAIALGLCAAELTRSYIFTGFPWALPGHILIDTAALPSASVFGAHGLGLFVLLGAAFVASAKVRPVLIGSVFWAVPFATAAILSPPPTSTSDAPVIRLVQPNAPQHQKWDPAFMPIFFQRGLEATVAPSTLDAPSVVIWPETALPELIRYSADVRPMIARAAGGVPVVIGAQRFDPEGNPRNALVVLEGPEGDIALVQDKHRLVPFGEYLPLPWLSEALGLGPLAAQLAGRYAAGDGPRTFDLPGIGSVLPMICYEAIFPQDLRRVDRPRAILHLTNDAWFGTFAGPQQHLALAKLRAAEAGLPLLRAANTGVSAVLDARGQILASLELGKDGHVDAPLPAALTVTPYARTGDWSAVVALVLAFLALLAWRAKAVAPRSVPL
ncbi:MAG: apolipoprotein N-acyltransferase [Pseudomonadota bacterium]